MNDMMKALDEVEAEIDKMLQEQADMRLQLVLLQEETKAAYARGYADGLQVGLGIKGVH